MGFLRFRGLRNYGKVLSRYRQRWCIPAWSWSYALPPVKAWLRYKNDAAGCFFSLPYGTISAVSAADIQQYLTLPNASAERLLWWGIRRIKTALVDIPLKIKWFSCFVWTRNENDEYWGEPSGEMIISSDDEKNSALSTLFYWEIACKEFIFWIK